MEYSIEQKCWSVIWYGMLGLPIIIQREYRKKFGLNVQLPNHRTIHRWFDKFFKDGSVNTKPKTKPKCTTGLMSTLRIDGWDAAQLTWSLHSRGRRILRT